MNPALPHRSRETRPWGGFEQFTLNELSTIKIHTVHRGARLSLQKHKDRDEFWQILSGNGTATVGDEQLPAETGKEFWIPRNTNHRIEASGDSDLVFLEIAFGQFDENDIERLEDDYGRL